MSVGCVRGVHARARLCVIERAVAKGGGRRRTGSNVCWRWAVPHPEVDWLLEKVHRCIGAPRALRVEPGLLAVRARRPGLVEARHHAGRVLHGAGCRGVEALAPPTRDRGRRRESRAAINSPRGRFHVALCAAAARRKAHGAIKTARRCARVGTPRRLICTPQPHAGLRRWPRCSARQRCW